MKAKEIVEKWCGMKDCVNYPDYDKEKNKNYYNPICLHCNNLHLHSFYETEDGVKK